MSRALDDLTAILQERGQEYGSGVDDKANLRESARLGIEPLRGVLIRMGDKWARILNLTTETSLAGIFVKPYDAVRVREQLIDIAGYAIKAMELLDEREPRVASQDFEIDAASEDADTSPHGRRGIRSLLGW